MNSFCLRATSRTWFIALLLPVCAAFTTNLVAQTAPAVVTTNPSNNATNTPTSVNSALNIVTGEQAIATFSLPMNPATLTGHTGTFTLADSSGTNIPGVVTLDVTNTVATFTPTLPALNPNTGYVATISTTAASTTGIALATPVTWSFTTKNVPFTAQAPVNLGTAGTFAILTKTGVTDVPASVINGNVGSSPITGAAIHLTCPEVATGIIYTVDAAGPLPCSIDNASYLTGAIGDMGIAYTDAAGRSLPDATELGAGEIGGLTLAPGLYKWSSNVLISTSVTLSGGPNDVWIFQIAGEINQASATSVILAGGALSKNIFWQAAGGVALGTTAHFSGVLLGQTMIAVKTGASVNGRLLAQTAVTLEQNAVTQPAK
jgi:Ice-binding-like/Bacterial Ig-like domain